MFAEGQIERGIAQGIGFALTEHLSRHKGGTPNPNFRDYKLPTALDIPPIETILGEIERPQWAIWRQSRWRSDQQSHAGGNCGRSL